jgi:hypothetical protein
MLFSVHVSISLRLIYLPAVANFRAFINSLKDAGVDMSHVSISHSYAILVGFEAYKKTRKRGREIVKKLVHRHDKGMSLEEEESDKREAGERERRFEELRQQVESEDRLEMAREQMRDKLHIERGKGGKKGASQES